MAAEGRLNYNVAVTEGRVKHAAAGRRPRQFHQKIVSKVQKIVSKLTDEILLTKNTLLDSW